MLRSWYRVCRVMAAGALVASCGSESSEAVSITISSPDPLNVDVGAVVTLVVQAEMSDGSTLDVTASAACALSGLRPPGSLGAIDATRPLIFTAEDPGVAEVTCRYDELSASLSVVVAGFRQVTVAGLQRGEIVQNSKVEVTAVVTALDPIGGWTDGWIQDEGGGPYSGIYIRDIRELDGQDPGMPIAIGDVVRVAGEYVERNGRSTLQYDDIEVTGRAEPVASNLAIPAIDLDMWEGCLIRVEMVEVIEPAFDDFTYAVTHSYDPEGEELLVETKLYDPRPARRQRYEALTGPLFPRIAEDGTVRVAITPRTTEDVGPLQVSISSLRNNQVIDGSLVALTDVVVVAADPVQIGQPFGLYVQDDIGGRNSGMYVRGNDGILASLAEGTTLSFVGELKSEEGRKVIDLRTLEVTGSGAEPIATTLDLGALQGTGIRNFESTLVRVTDVEVSNPALSDTTWEVTEVGGGLRLPISTQFYEEAVAQGDVFAQIVGVVYCDANECALAPRKAEDLSPAQ